MRTYQRLWHDVAIQPNFADAKANHALRPAYRDGESAHQEINRLQKMTSAEVTRFAQKLGRQARWNSRVVANPETPQVLTWNRWDGGRQLLDQG